MDASIYFISWAVNQIFLCVHVPEPAEVDEGTVVERVGALYGEARAAELRGELERLRAEGREDDAIRVLDRLRARMGDLSEFMKTFKQRVTQWYNRELGHEGTLWSGRFKSVLLDRDDAVRVVANYIHANPVRARMIVGGVGFVLEMAGRLRAKFRGSPTLRKIGRSLYASHGGRSAPRRVA